ncbi:hypothetical protein J6X15_01950 [Candidatus Saccharibacteria bacterium]|nr:hypothetical protein [Candidatus Saccharibacteria bacterium]
MWGYIKKIIHFAIFSFLLEGVMVVGYMSFDGILPNNEFEYIKMATCMVPGVMVSLGVLSLIKTQRKRLNGRYENDPISTVALVILEIIMVAVIIGASIGAAFLANYLYTI